MEKMNRRKFLSFLGLGIVTAGAGSGLVYASVIETHAVEIVEQRLPLRGLGPGLSGLRAAQISDLHMGAYISRAQLEHVVALILAQKPDLAFITGDFLTNGGDRQRGLDDLHAALRPLAQQMPVFVVLGNHDHNQNSGPRLQALFAELGIQELSNTLLTFQRGSDTLFIAGIDSVSTGNQRLDIVDRAAPEGAPVILLAHEPDMADFSAPIKKFALQLSGHSHGGQVNLPLLGRPVLPWMGKKYPAGLYQVGDMYVYTNRGIGSYPIPVRVNCRPEITIFTFVSSQQPG